MHIRSTFITHPQTPKLMQPCEGALNHPPGHAQMAAMHSASLANQRHDATPPQDAPTFFTVVPAIGLHVMRFAQRSAATTGDGSHAIAQRQELRSVVPIGASQDDIERDAVGIDKQVVFAARLAPISRVRSGFFPPCTARTDELSAITREKSRRWAPRSLLSRT